MTFEEAVEFKKNHLHLIGTKSTGFPGISGHVSQLKIIGHGVGIYSVHIYVDVDPEGVDSVEGLLESYLERSSS